MPLIEGFGDEVTLLLIALLTGVVMVLAWMSTQVDSRFLVPIIILDRERFSALMHRLRGIAELRFAVGEQAHEDSPRPEGSEAEHSSAGEEAHEDSPRPEGSEAERGSNTVDTATSMEATPPSQQDSLQQNPETYLQQQQQQQQQEASTLSPVTDVTLADTGSSANDGDRETVRTEFQEPCVPESKSQTSILESFSSARQNVCNDSIRQESTLRPADPTEMQSPLSNETPDLSRQAGNQEDEALPTHEGQIQIRLQYVDGRMRMVYASPDDTVRDFKRNHFSAELAGHSVVRFVMSGQELRNDDLTLRSYRVSDGSVIHCLITQARVEPVVISVDPHNFDIGFLMFPLFGFLLTLLWYARIAYRNYFSGASTCSLVAISFLYLVALIGSFRSGRLNHPHHE